MKKLLLISSLCILFSSSDASSERTDGSISVFNWIQTEGIQEYMEQNALSNANLIKEHANKFFQSTEDCRNKERDILITGIHDVSKIFEYAKYKDGVQNLENIMNNLKTAKTENITDVYNSLIQLSEDLYKIHKKCFENVNLDKKIFEKKIDFSQIITWSNTIGINDQNVIDKKELNSDDMDILKWKNLGFRYENIFDAKKNLGEKIIKIANLIKSSSDNFIKLKKDGDKSSPELEDTLNNLIEALGNANQLFRDARMGGIGSPEIVYLRKNLRLNGVDADVKDDDLIQISKSLHDIGDELKISRTKFNVS